jgi:hypothetical protein
VSPLVIKPKPLTDDTTEIKVSISFNDSCGKTKKAEFSYSKAGIAVLSKVDDPAVIPPSVINTGEPAGNGTDDTKKNAGVVPTAAGAFGTFGLGLLSVMAFLAML